MNKNQAKIFVFWVAVAAAVVILDNPDPNRILAFGAFGVCWALHQYLLSPLYPESMRVPKGRGLMAWIDGNPTMKTWVPIYYFVLAMFSVASMFLFPGVVGNYITSVPRLIPIIFFPFIVYLMKAHLDLYRLLGQKSV